MTVTELKALLDRYLKRVDLQDLYDDWIGFTSSRIDKQLRLAEQEYRTVTIPTGQFVALPPDFIEMRHIESSSNGGTPMEYATPGQLDGIRAAYSDSFSPLRWYTILNNQIELSPAPAADNTDVSLEMFYYAKLADLATGASTNKVLTAYPQLYLYGCMIEASAFRNAEKDSGAYAQLWRDYANDLNTRAQAGRFSSDGIQMRAS